MKTMFPMTADKTSYIKFEYFDDNDGIFDKRL